MFRSLRKFNNLTRSIVKLGTFAYIIIKEINIVKQFTVAFKENSAFGNVLSHCFGVSLAKHYNMFHTERLTNSVV